MKILLSREQVEFLRFLCKDTVYEDRVSSFPVGTEFEINEDLADEIRDLCALYESGSVIDGGGVILDEKGWAAVELVDLLYH